MKEKKTELSFRFDFILQNTKLYFKKKKNERKKTIKRMFLVVWEPSLFHIQDYKIGHLKRDNSQGKTGMC